MVSGSCHKHLPQNHRTGAQRTEGRKWGTEIFRARREAQVLAFRRLPAQCPRLLSREASRTSITPDPPIQARGATRPADCFLHLFLIKCSGWRTFLAVGGWEYFSECVIQKIQFLCLKNIYHLWHHRNGRVYDETGAPGSSQTEGTFVQFSQGDFSKASIRLARPGQVPGVWENRRFSAGKALVAGPSLCPFHHHPAHLCRHLETPNYFGNQLREQKESINMEVWYSTHE